MLPHGKRTTHLKLGVSLWNFQISPSQCRRLAVVSENLRVFGAEFTCPPKRRVRKSEEMQLVTRGANLQCDLRQHLRIYDVYLAQRVSKIVTSRISGVDEETQLVPVSVTSPTICHKYCTNQRSICVRSTEWTSAQHEFFLHILNTDEWNSWLIQQVKYLKTWNICKRQITGQIMNGCALRFHVWRYRTCCIKCVRNSNRTTPICKAGHAVHQTVVRGALRSWLHAPVPPEAESRRSVFNLALFCRTQSQVSCKKMTTCTCVSDLHFVVNWACPRYIDLRGTEGSDQEGCFWLPATKGWFFPCKLLEVTCLVSGRDHEG